MRHIFLFGSLFLSLFSHDVWIVPDQTGGTFHYGHRAPETGEAKTLPFDPTAVTKSCRTASGDTTGWNGTCDELLARYAGGSWSKTFDGTQKGDRSAHPDALYSWESVEIVRFVRRPLAPVTEGFALVPAGPLTKARIGKRFTFRTVLDGKPLPGIPVAYFGSTRGVTDGDGKINIRLRHPGIQQITASYTAKSSKTNIDKKVTSYSLNFEVRQ